MFLINPFDISLKRSMGELIPLSLLCIEIIDQASDDSLWLQRCSFIFDQTFITEAFPLCVSLFDLPAQLLK
jgi:hypothetical protein